MDNNFHLDSTETKSETPQICGYLSTYGMTKSSGDASKKYIELEGASISIVGKNGTGKSTILSELALAARPWAHVNFRYTRDPMDKVMNEDKFPFWRGGFILSSPHEYIGLLNKLQNIEPLNLNHPNTEEKEVLSFLYTPPGSVLATNLNRHDVNFDSPHWYEEFEMYQNEMRRFSKIGLFPVRVQRASSGDGPVDDPLASSWAISRVIFRNEDTTYSNLLVTDFVNRLKEFAALEEELPYGELLTKFSEHKEVEWKGKIGNKFSITTFPIFNNPLFTPWALGGLLIWNGADHYDVRSDLRTIIESLDEISIERPKRIVDFEQSLPIVAAIDSKILNLTTYSDLEQMLRGFPLKDTPLLYYLNEDIRGNWDRLKPRIIEILVEWDVIYSVASVLNRQLAIEIDPSTGNFHDVIGEFNETARCWIHRAWQIAVIEEYDTPYKLAIWDEPEIGLHPTALDTVAIKVIPFVTNLGIKLIYSTHSMRLAISAAQIKACDRDEFSKPYLSDWYGINAESARLLGFTKVDLLENIRKIIIVEGEMDREVLTVIFENELEITRTRIVTLGGTSNLMTIPDAEILIESLNSKIMIVLDGLNRSNLSEKIVSELNAACQSGSWLEVKKSLWKIRQEVENLKEEGVQLTKLLDLLSNRGDNEIVKRFEFFLFTSLDISNELPITGVLGKNTQFKDWEAVIKRMNDEKIKVTSGSQKSFLKKLGTPITKGTCRRAAIELLDRPLSDQFLKFKEIAFG